MRTALMWVLLAGLVLVIWAAPRWKGGHSAAWWAWFGYPRAALRTVSGWRRLSTALDLAVPKRPAMTLLGGIILRGQALRPVPPRIGFPRRLRGGSGIGMTVSVRMHPGQTPDAYLAASEGIAHAWRMHTIRVTSPTRGRVLLTCLPVDPLRTTEADEPAAKPGELLRVTVGRRDDGKPWVIDFRSVPHWLIVGATQSGKSNWISALVCGLAPQPVALVGVDCKGGMELSLYEPRLSALATDRPQAVRLLGALVDMLNERMATCRVHGARSVWDLPDDVRPVPVVLIVDEVAELFLAATADEKKEAGQAATSLIRLAQLGRALGVFTVVAGQRFGSDLGPGATALRAQLGGRVCHRVSDKGTAEMTLGDLNPDALDAAQAITPEEVGIAVTAQDGVWLRARSAYVSAGKAAHIAEEHATTAPALRELVAALTPPDERKTP